MGLVLRRALLLCHIHSFHQLPHGCAIRVQARRDRSKHPCRCCNPRRVHGASGSCTCQGSQIWRDLPAKSSDRRNHSLRVDLKISSKMASRAHERAQKILGNPTQEQLAQLIMDDVSAQSANAEGKPPVSPGYETVVRNISRRSERGYHADLGVLAYARKPAHREKPNERFLLGTIRSVAFGKPSSRSNMQGL